MPSWTDQLADALAGRYRLERELGQGGMAVVYLAHDLRHHRAVAIKVLRPDAASALGPERFRREIAIVAPLVHPHIVSLLDSGEAGGTLFYVMPYLAGDSLRARLTHEGHLPVAETIRIMRGVFSALADAHAAGIVHRDIKPENILLTGDHAQVADFGIARALASSQGQTLTRTGHAIGTTAYMAPEQAAGDPLLDHRADIYSAGLLWYELLTGRHPFADLTPQQQMAAHFVREIPPVETMRPAVPKGLAALVMRCLEKEPSERWQQATDVLRQLDGMLADGNVATALRSSGEPSLKRFRLTEPLLDGLSGGYDPRMSGDAIQYLDNGKLSDVLVCFFDRWCLDPQDGAALLRQTRYRAVTPAFFGFEAGRRYRVTLPLDDHLRLIGGLLDDLVTSTEPRLVVLVGFSAGADLALRLAADHTDGGRRRIHGVVAMSPNVVSESAFASAVLARMTLGGENDVLPYLRRVVDAQRTLQEWADVSEYLARLARRFRDDFSVLQRFAADLADPFAEGERLAAFARCYRMAARHHRQLRLVFEDSALCRQLVSDLHRAQKERQLLGADHRAGAMIVEAGTGHFDLEESERICLHLDAVVELLRQPEVT